MLETGVVDNLYRVFFSFSEIIFNAGAIKQTKNTINERTPAPR